MKNKYRFKLLDTIIFFITRFICFIYTRLFLGFRCRDKYRKAKNETCILLSNHQTDFDPFCIAQSLPFTFSCVATDNIFINKFVTWIFKKIYHVIPKKKGTADLSCVMTMCRTANAGGNILIFPEGNRSFAEFQYFIDPDFPKILKKIKSTIILYNLHGGTGIRPRFSKSKRHGKFWGEIKRVMKYEEYANMENADILEIIKSTLKVYDSDLDEKYTSSSRAEYLERMFFVCPVCKTACQMHSSHNTLTCLACGNEVEYTEDLKLKSDNPKFGFERTIDYWNYQKRYITELEIKEDETIFSEENVQLLLSDPFEKRKLLYKGSMKITDKGLYFGDLVHYACNIASGSIIQSQKLVYSYQGHEYLIKGDKRFNPVKYMLLFSKIDTQLKVNGREKYYNLEEDIC